MVPATPQASWLGQQALHTHPLDTPCHLPLVSWVPAAVSCSSSTSQVIPCLRTFDLIFSLPGDAYTTAPLPSSESCPCIIFLEKLCPSTQRPHPNSKVTPSLIAYHFPVFPVITLGKHLPNDGFHYGLSLPSPRIYTRTAVHVSKGTSLPSVLFTARAP